MGKLKLTSLQKRVFSALVLAPLVLWMIGNGGWTLLALVLLCAAICIYEWIQLSLKTDREIIFSVLGTIYVSLCFFACYWIGALAPQAGVVFILMVWASDVGAYVAGKVIGGPKMVPKISPNKTWAGSVGAFLSPVLVGILFVVFSSYYWQSEAFNWQFLKIQLVLGAVVGIAGQVGDLIVSLLKRKAEVKDAGGLIPGHGGLLDRVDALMLAALASYIALKVMLNGFG